MHNQLIIPTNPHTWAFYYDFIFHPSNQIPWMKSEVTHWFPPINEKMTLPVILSI